MLFRSLQSGGDPDAGGLYLWHLRERRKKYYDGDKGAPDDPEWEQKFLAAARRLFLSMNKHGFLKEHAVPLDPSGELLGGAHRVACALVVGCDVKAQKHSRRVWAPAWDRQWFLDHGVSSDDLQRIDAALAAMKG